MIALERNNLEAVDKKISETEEVFIKYYDLAKRNKLKTIRSQAKDVKDSLFQVLKPLYQKQKVIARNF